MKKIWFTVFGLPKSDVAGIEAQLQGCGAEVNKHVFENNTDNIDWSSTRESLISPEVSLWAILADKEKLRESSTLYALSLLAITVQAKKGHDFPIVILQAQDSVIDSQNLPRPLKGVKVCSLADLGLISSLVAKDVVSLSKVAPEYFLDVYCHPQIGQWFEAGPLTTLWKGAMFGVNGAAISFQAVGTRGMLPSKSVLNFAQKNLELDFKREKFTAWAVQNELKLGTSHFVKVNGSPSSIIFGPYPNEESAEMFFVDLKPK